MPDVFDEFFARFGKKTSDYYRLRRLDPPYRLFSKNSIHSPPPQRVESSFVLAVSCAACLCPCWERFASAFLPGRIVGLVTM